ncbi:MAG: response regulator [Labilithrix sp.]|nr:response regulator [Labilithrix sp.]MCW5835941.1 response regulator [Labilithrix sp.]
MTEVLIVEDDEALRELLALILEGEGFEVATAANGREALASIARSLPRIVLLDMTMPLMDGWQFCRELDRRGGPRPQIVVITAATDPARRAGEVDADGWLAKPFDRDALVALVQGLRGGADSSAPPAR